MGDRDLRQLERAGAAGGPAAQARLAREQVRHGELSRERYGCCEVIERIGDVRALPHLHPMDTLPPMDRPLWKAWDHDARRVVALYSLAGLTRRSRLRLRAELQLLERVVADQPGLQRMILVEDGAFLGVASDWIDGGRTLETVWEEADLPGRVASFRDAAQLVARLHEADAVHRDLNLGVFLVDRDGALHLTELYSSTLVGLDVSPPLTRCGSVIGNPAYVAPEILRGSPSGLSPMIDVWSLGCLLYEALTGQQAFQAPTMAELGARILRRELDLGALHAVERPALARVCLQSLQLDRYQRYGNAGKLVADFDRAVTGQEMEAGSLPRRGFLERLFGR